MRDIIIDLNNLSPTLYEDTIIREGEHNASQLVITLTEELKGYQNNIVLRLNNEAPLIASNVPNVAGVITYPLPNTVTFEYGQLRVEIQSYNLTTMLTKSLVIPFKVIKGIGGVPVTIPPTLYGLEGAVGAVPDTFVVRDNIGAVNADSFNLDLTPVTLPSGIPTGKMQWNPTYNVMDVGITGTTVGASLQVGQDLVCWCRNNTASTMPVGSVVAITGSVGELPSIKLADSDATVNDAKVLGVVGGFPIGSNSNGYVVLTGFVSGVNTSSFNEGDVLYLATTAGQLTNVAPNPPAIKVSVGYVVKKAGNGKIYVDIDREANASLIPIQDSANNYTSTNVEGALLEIANKLKAHGIPMP